MFLKTLKHCFLHLSMFNSNTSLNNISSHVTCTYYKQFKKIEVFINCIERVKRSDVQIRNYVKHMSTEIADTWINECQYYLQMRKNEFLLTLNNH